MKNYKWLVHTNNSNIPANKINNYLITVVDENFKSARAFERVYDMDGVIDMNLFKYGLKSQWDGQSRRATIQLAEYLKPDKTEVEITAPIYNLRHKLIMDSYTATINQYTLPDGILLLYEKCKEAVSMEMANKFQEFYDRNSFDEGLSSSFILSERMDLQCTSVFFEKYVPDGFIKVCEYRVFGDYFHKHVLFMKESDYEGRALTISVLPALVGPAIGLGAENIKKVAKQLNACHIEVKPNI